LRAVLTAALLLAACAPMTAGPDDPVAAASPPSGAATPAGGWLLPGTEWRLVELDGAPFAARATARLTEDGRVTGQAPCNRFTATWSGRWPELTFTPLAATRMACPELAAEDAFFAALGRVTRAEVTADGLILSGDDGTRLRFERL
jgi:heat shock protein HslJ